MCTSLKIPLPSVIGLLLTFLLCAACAPGRKTQRFLKKQLGAIEESAQFTGFLMVDTQTSDTLHQWNAGKYFTPASNMKVFTLYAALKTLPDRIPALKYRVSRTDTLHVLGTGDPSALHPRLGDTTAASFMRRYDHIVLHTWNFRDPPWGAGWAWDDFDQPYMPPRSSLPLYGNVVEIVGQGGQLQVSPPLFRDSVIVADRPFRRRPDKNLFYYPPSGSDTLTIPMRLDPGLSRELLQAATGVPVGAGLENPGGPWQTLGSIPSDSLLREMMGVSDNFLAEQTMLLVSSTLGDTLSFTKARDHILQTHLEKLPTPPRWVDGSGLSRYNLCSPESLVYVLMELYREIPRERLFDLMARGDRQGTLKDAYLDTEGPYLFGKTGSLSNNHNLCGYLKTRSGKTVVFSFMNNHYRKPTALVKGRMERILSWVREHY